MFSVFKSFSQANVTNNSSEISGVISLLYSQSFNQNHIFLFVLIPIESKVMKILIV